MIRPFREGDWPALWPVLAAILAAGDTYAFPADATEDVARAWWLDPAHQCFVAEHADGRLLGSYYLQPNQRGNGDHVCNCGYVVAPAAAGHGVATAMCEHSQAHALRAGYAAMQFNFVVASNQRAVALWQRLGFAIVGRIPQAFRHPTLGLVDALVMHKALAQPSDD